MIASLVSGHSTVTENRNAANASEAIATPSMKVMPASANDITAAIVKIAGGEK